jgi:hypothetical protein
MLVADKQVLKANLAAGTLNIQLELVYLYVDNLNTITTLAALFMQFCETGTVETVWPDYGVKIYPLSVLYYIFVAISMLSCVLIIAVSTIETTWGPSMALNGNSHEDVMTAVEHMKDQQKFVMKVICVGGTSIIVSASLLCFAKEGIGVGFMEMCIYAIGLYFIASEGSKAYLIFHEGRAD